MKHIGACLIASLILIAQLIVLTGMPERASAYTPHAPIYINGNGGFNASNGVTGGSGSPSDPYIIEGWEIDSSTTNGIVIEDTNASFVIRGVYIHGVTYLNSGVVLYNAKNGSIENSTITDNFVGILIDRWSGSTAVMGNNLSNNEDFGVYSESSLIVENNTFYYNMRGLFMYAGAVVKGNLFLLNRMNGIDLSWSAIGGTIADNRMDQNGGHFGWNGGGIVFENDSAHWFVTHNRISGNNETGILISGTNSNITVEFNEISYNIHEGVRIGSWVNSTFNNIVRHNNFIDNAIPQAFDYSGSANRWDVGCSGGGNYWSDYTGGDSIDCNTGMAGSDGYGDTPYVLDSDSKDNYPFMTPLNLSMNNTPPTVTVTSPNGGESWAGGSVHAINWTMNDDRDSYLTVWIKYQVNGGTWEDIPGAQNMYLPVGNRSFSWTVPQVNTSNALVRVIVMDSDGMGGNDQSDDFFTIYLAGPYIVATVPVNGSVEVPLDAWIVVTFSESMNITRVTWQFLMGPSVPLTPIWSGGDKILTLTHTTPFSGCVLYRIMMNGTDSDGNNLVPGPVPNPFQFSTNCFYPVILSTDPADGETDVALDAPISVSFSMQMNISSVYASILPSITLNASWSMNDTVVTYNHATLFAACTDYIVNITGLDTSGYPLIPGSVPNPWTFSTCVVSPPSVSTANPVGGEDWTGGFVKTLSWNVTDPDDPLSNLTTDLWYSTNGGSSWIAIVAGLPGTTPIQDWLVPFVNTTTAKVKVCATDPMNNTGCDYSGNFSIDSTPPYVISTYPSNGTADVSWNVTIIVWWSEMMNITNGSFTFAPSKTGNVTWNGNRDTVRFTPDALLSPCTRYTVGLNGFRDDGDPGYPMIGKYYFSFVTLCPGPPSVNLTSPVGGEYWPGGSAQQVTWTVVDDFTPQKDIIIYLNYTSSVSSGPIAGPIKDVTSCLWILPTINATDVKVNITAIDGDMMRNWDESRNFTIDSTPPFISSHSPTGWNVILSSYVEAVFTEPVDISPATDAASFGLRDDTTMKWAALSWTKTPPTWPQDIRFVPTQPLASCHAFTAFVNGTFHDRASWAITNPMSWTFHTVCPPSVSLVSSPAGKDWSGGSSHDVSWTMSDEIDVQLRVWMNYSKDGGADGYPYQVFSVSRATGTTIFTWPVPLIDTTAARLRVMVMDSSGLKAVVASGVFTIDSTPPSILSSAPLNGSGGTTITDTIQVVFSEPIVRSTAEASFSIFPDPGGITFTWDTTTSGKDILFVGHKPFKSKTDYRVSFSDSIKDISDPGNSPISPLWIVFSTKPPPPATPPVALAVGKNQVAVGEVLTLDGSRSTGTNLIYIWTITDNQNNIVDVLAGKFANYTFTKNGRYRVVLMIMDMSTGLSGTDDFEIVVTSSENAGTIILLSSAIIAGALIGGTEVGRVALFMLLAVPAYRRKMKGKDDSLGRGMVLGYIMVHPGDTYSDIKHNLDLNDGTLTWHLSKLEKEEMIKSKIKGTRRHYYPFSMPLPFEDGGELHEIERLLIGAVRSDPGRPVKLLAEELSVSSQLALYHLRKLSQKGYLKLERKGLYLKVYPAKDRNS